VLVLVVEIFEGLLGALVGRGDVAGDVSESLEVLLVVLAGDETLLDVALHHPAVEEAGVLHVSIAAAHAVEVTSSGLPPSQGPPARSAASERRPDQNLPPAL